LPGALHKVLGGQTLVPPPLWLMRQAGRYLPEYRALRAKAGSFWALCVTPDLAAEATLQPVRRFGLDAAIIFSDILVVPVALGAAVTFVEGPQLTPISTLAGLECRPEQWAVTLAPVYEAIRVARAALEPARPLIGFAGAPWTLATYLAGGAGSGDQKAAKLWSYRNATEFGALIDILVDCVARHLVAQLKAGAEAVQLFDSWAQGLTPAGFDRWVIEPTRRIVEAVRAAVPAARIIGFPRGATMAGYEEYARRTGVDAVSLDAAVPLDWAVEKLGTVLQGNLDPVVLVAGGQAMVEGVKNILAATRGKPFIFNLGHGILPDTPPELVAELVRLVRSGQ